MGKRIKSLLRRLMPHTIRRHRILGGRLRGRHIVTSWHDYPAAILGKTEKHLLEWFEQNVNAGETWLDIGAHYGYTAIALSRLVGPRGRVFAFEPMLSTAGCLAQTRLLNDLRQLTVIPFALSSIEQLQLHRLPSVRGMIDSKLRDQEATEGIVLARLDWLWPRLAGDEERIDGVKIDVEGMEIEVLRGMAGLLMAGRPKMVIEVHEGVARDELVHILEGLGYSPRAVPIDPVPGETEPQYLDDRSYAFQAARFPR